MLCLKQENKSMHVNCSHLAHLGISAHWYRDLMHCYVYIYSAYILHLLFWWCTYNLIKLKSVSSNPWISWCESLMCYWLTFSQWLCLIDLIISYQHPLLLNQINSVSGFSSQSSTKNSPSWSTVLFTKLTDGVFNENVMQ